MTKKQKRKLKQTIKQLFLFWTIEIGVMLLACVKAGIYIIN